MFFGHFDNAKVNQGCHNKTDIYHLLFFYAKVV